MKKFLVILLILILTIFTIFGCTGLGTLPNNSDGESENGDENGIVNVEIEGSTLINGYNYITPGNHDLIVTFPFFAKGASVGITECTGEYSEPTKDNTFELFPPEDWDPEIGALIWKGSVNFNMDQNNCCTSFVTIIASDIGVVVVMPVIVSNDLDNPCIK